MGKIIDVLVLEPETFDNRFEIYEPFRKQSKDAKAKWAQMCEDAEKKKVTLITTEQKQKADWAAESLMDDRDAREVLEAKKKVQIKLQWYCKKNNLPLIGYADFESAAWDLDWVVDLKATGNADPIKFMRTASDLEYELQCGAYLDAYARRWFRFPEFAFLVVEFDWPFGVSFNYCDSKYKTRALEEWHGTLAAFRYCMDNNLFYESYGFRNMKLKNYFSMEIPGYKRKKFTGFADTE